MPVMDEFKEQRATMKDKPLKDRIAHFWYYYKWHVIASGAILIFLISLLHAILTNKDPAFRAMLADVGITGNEEALVTDFAEYSKIDTETYDVYIDSTIYLTTDERQSAAKITAMTANADVDVLSLTKGFFERYAYNGTFLDLRTCMSEDELNAYKGQIFYIDQQLFDTNFEHSAEQDYEYQYAEDPLDPNSMTEPVPVGILVSNSKILNNVYVFVDTSFIGIPNNTKRLENALAFIKYIK